MLLDSLNQFSAAQAITATAISQNVIDLGPLGGVTPANLIRAIGDGEPINLTIVWNTLATSGGATTLVVTLESDSAVGLATTPVVHWTSTTIAKATLVNGYFIAQGLIIPQGIPLGSYQRYVGLRYTVATGPFTAGSISAWLHKGTFNSRTYESGFSTGVN